MAWWQPGYNRAKRSWTLLPPNTRRSGWGRTIPLRCLMAGWAVVMVIMAIAWIFDQANPGTLFLIWVLSSWVACKIIRAYYE